MDNSKSVNYWPGFVDVLANVVLTMVFVVVVFTVALLDLSQSKVKAVQVATGALSAQQAAVAAADPLQTKIAALEQQLAATQEDNEALRRALQQRPPQTAGTVPRTDIKISNAPKLAPLALASVSIRAQQSSLQVVFPAGTIELDSDSLKRLENAFAVFSADAKVKGIYLLGVPEEGPYSEGRRLAYYRNLALRNWLIDHGVPAGRIGMRIADSATDRAEAVVEINLGH